MLRTSNEMIRVVAFLPSFRLLTRIYSFLRLLGWSGVLYQVQYLLHGVKIYRYLVVDRLTVEAALRTSRWHKHVGHQPC